MRFIIGWMLTTLLLGVSALVVVNKFFPVEYTEQNDYRSRQYYPALVIDKSEQEHCSAKHCYSDFELGLELDDKSKLRLYVSKETHDKAVLGEKISFERHLTDPVVRRNQHIQYSVLLIICAFSLALFLYEPFLSKWRPPKMPGDI